MPSRDEPRRTRSRSGRTRGRSESTTNRKRSRSRKRSKGKKGFYIGMTVGGVLITIIATVCVILLDGGSNDEVAEKQTGKASEENLASASAPSAPQPIRPDFDAYDIAIHPNPRELSNNPALVRGNVYLYGPREITVVGSRKRSVTFRFDSKIDTSQLELGAEVIVRGRVWEASGHAYVLEPEIVSVTPPPKQAPLEVTATEIANALIREDRKAMVTYFTRTLRIKGQLLRKQHPIVHGPSSTKPVTMYVKGKDSNRLRCDVRNGEETNGLRYGQTITLEGRCSPEYRTSFFKDTFASFRGKFVSATPISGQPEHITGSLKLTANEFIQRIQSQSLKSHGYHAATELIILTGRITSLVPSESEDDGPEVRIDIESSTGKNFISCFMTDKQPPGTLVVGQSVVIGGYVGLINCNVSRSSCRIRLRDCVMY